MKKTAITLLILSTLTINSCWLACEGYSDQVLEIKNNSSHSLFVSSSLDSAEEIEYNTIKHGESRSISFYNFNGKVTEFNQELNIYKVLADKESTELKDKCIFIKKVPKNSVTKINEDLDWRGDGTVTFELVITNELLK
ncbi:MAG: hypothetical protein Ta2B_28120 [Termitinemataceae bacterium]|nr:MAG: hypothetical protein Ta2B_28120 [Termitinemataceae bacterium]